MNKSNLERFLEKYLSGELSGESYRKLLRWLETMELNEVAGSTFSIPDDERLYRLLISTKSTFEDIDAFRPYSFDPRSMLTKPWVQFTLTLISITGMIVATRLLKG